MKMKLYGMTLCYNEAQMIPYIMPYYERMNFDKLIIYDNESTDNTVELLKQYPFVEIRTFHTGLKNNRIQSQLKSKMYQEFNRERDAWLYISDFDEVLYYNGDFRSFLEEKDRQGYTYLNQQMIDLICDEMPDISDGSLIHEKCELGNWWDKQYGCKMTLFKVTDTYMMSYTAGAHSCNWLTKLQKVSLNGCGIKSLHIKNIGYERMKAKSKLAAERRSEEDRKLGYGIQYESLKNDEYFDKTWNNKKATAVLLSSYINN